jgi:hypothetical protein
MIDKSRRFTRPRVALEELATLKGKQLEFNSLAEMQTIRSREIPDAVHVLYYDEVITYGQTNERANKIANYPTRTSRNQNGPSPIGPKILILSGFKACFKIFSIHFE